MGTNNDLLIIGVEKTGAFVSHFEEIDKTAIGRAYISRAVLMPS